MNKYKLYWFYGLNLFFFELIDIILIKKICCLFISTKYLTFTIFLLKKAKNRQKEEKTV